MNRKCVFYVFGKYRKSGSRCSQGHFFKDLHPQKLSFLTLSWNKFRLILGYVALCASRCLQIASSLPQDGSLERFLAQLHANLGPSCLKLAPNQAQVGSKLVHVEAKLVQNPLPKSPGGSHKRSWESPGRFPGCPRGHEVLQEASEVQTWLPRAYKITKNGRQKAPILTPNLSKT